MESSSEPSRARSLQGLWELLPAHVQHLVLAAACSHDASSVSNLRLVCGLWLDEVAACVTSLSLLFEPLGAPLPAKLSIMAHRFPNVTRLDLTAHHWGPDALAALLRLRHLTSLCLASSCSKDSDIVALADSSLAGQLAELSVRNCFSISNASLARLAALPALTSLDLSGCWRVNAHGLRLLAAAGRLQELRLGFCEQVNNESVALLASGCLGLHLLDLSWCLELGEGALAAIGQHLKGLRQLWLTRCVRVTDAGLVHLARGCPQLRELGLSGCSLITDVGAAQLAQLASLAVLDLRGAYAVSPAGVAALNKLPLLRRLVVDAAGWQPAAAADSAGAAAGAADAADTADAADAADAGGVAAAAEAAVEQAA